MTTGIAVDNYKLEDFKKGLKDGGFDNIAVTAFTTDTSFIRVKIKEERLEELSKLVKTLNLHAKRKN